MADKIDAVGVRLASRRKERGISQMELARVSGVDNSTISRIERGDIPSPGTETLRKLAYALRIDATDLVPTSAAVSGPHLLPRTLLAIPPNAPPALMELFDRQVEGIARLVFGGPSGPNALPVHRNGADGANANGAEGADGSLNPYSQTRNNSLFGHDRLPVLAVA